MNNLNPHGDQVPLPDDLPWRTAQLCSNGACVEVADLSDGGAAVRSSKDPGGAVLVFDRAEWTTFLAAVKDREFD